MLTVKVFVNEKCVDTLNILNTGIHRGEIYTYSVQGKDLNDRHMRNQGYRKLIVKVLKKLIVRGEKR